MDGPVVGGTQEMEEDPERLIYAFQVKPEQVGCCTLPPLPVV
jgi:hypothetical protein